MNIPKKISSLIIKFIKNNSNIDDDNTEVIEYGLNLFLSTLIKFIIVLFLASLFGITKYVLLSIVSFGLLRTFAGGIHLKSSFGCLIGIIFIYFSAVYISLYLSFSLMFIYILFLCEIILIFLYAPADIAEKPILSKTQSKKLKRYSIYTILLFFIMAIYVPSHIVRNIIAISTFIECVTLTPLLYKITNTKRGDDHEEKTII